MKKLVVIIATLIAHAGVVHAEGDWDIRLSPYGWFAGVKGNASTIPGAPDITGKIKTAGLGILTTYDSRNNNYYPTDGQWFEAKWMD